jgi:hypothetical protein
VFFGVETSLLERVSKTGTASNQALTFEVGGLLSLCHEEAAEAVERGAMEAD